MGRKYLWELPSKSFMELSRELSFFLIASVEIYYGRMDERGARVRVEVTVTVKVEVGAIGTKGLWGVVPNRGPWSGGVFQ